MKCCSKPKFKLEKSEKLRRMDKSEFRDNDHYYNVEEEVQKYIIFCENCGKIERKGEM